MKNIKLKSVLVLLTVLGVYQFTISFGPLDTYPRVLQTQKSIDGAWEFQVCRRKLEALNPFADSEIVFRLKDLGNDRVFEQTIWTTTWWNRFGHWRKHNARFGANEIVVDDFWIAEKENMIFRMCPSLDCLENSE